MTAARIVAAALAGTAVAHADPVSLQFATRVPEGQRPSIKIVANEAIESIAVDLLDENGKPTLATFEGLARGASKEITLDGGAGKHRYTGLLKVTRASGGSASENSLSFESVVVPALKLDIDKARVDLAAHRLELRLSRPPGKVVVRVFGDTGKAALSETEHDLAGHAAGETMTITWPPPAAADNVARIDVRAVDIDGFFADVSLYPWSVYIPHEEVAFATDSAAIAASEAPKLAASLAKISGALKLRRGLGAVKLFIAGHTDSAGAPAYNLNLSRRRAQEIARWFRSHGLRLPIAYEGFGEHALLVPTPDETSEPRNRRVDYILAIDEPAMKAAGSFHPTWKGVP